MMVVLPVLALIAAATSEPGEAQDVQPPRETSARASAHATVRILSGARVTLGRSADQGSFTISQAEVRDETGARRPAQLVEFQ